MSLRRRNTTVREVLTRFHAFDEFVPFLSLVVSVFTLVFLVRLAASAVDVVVIYVAIYL